MDYKQELWIEAKKKCHLEDEEIRMAKELGINPRSLIKNIPTKKELWKAPVKEWIRDLYESRQSKCYKNNVPVQMSEKAKRLKNQNLPFD